nr:MAG TPA: helix-turn-helix domain protein [Bacteriophage sp.]
MEEKILERLDQIQQYLMLQVKQVLNIKEAAIILGMQPETVRGMVNKHTIPFYKPNRNLLYFRKEELEQWMMQNRTSTDEEIESQVEAINYSMNISKQ